MTDIAALVSVVEIERIRLREGKCQFSADPDELSASIRVVPTHRASVTREPDEVDRAIRIDVAFGLSLQSEAEDETELGTIQAVFDVSYKVERNEAFSSEVFQDFADFNAVFNTWPYWREFVQMSCARMSLPPITVPVFRILPRTASDDSEQD